MPWLADAMVSCLLFAGWAVCQKLAIVNGCSAIETTIYTQTAIVVMWASSIVANPSIRFYSAPITGAGYALAAGVFTSTGGIWFNKALQAGGAASAVTVISAAYPAVAFIIAVVALGEELTWLKILGAVLTISGAACFAL
jgi:uncharacterized membrane protein